MYRISQERRAEVVVIGGGGSGLVAAVRAAQQSGKRVVLLEKTKRTGGGASFATFMQTFDSRWQAERGLECRTADYIRGVQESMYWRIDPQLAFTAVRATGSFVDWLLELKPEIGDVLSPGKYIFPTPYDPVGPQTGGAAPRGFGRVVVDAMDELCREFGVEVLTEHRAVDLEMNDGRVSAVIAQGEMGYVHIACEACILASGSWICNDKVTKKVCPAFDRQAFPLSPHLNPAYTGDGVALAEKAGAFVDWDSFCIRFLGPTGLHFPPILRAMLQSVYTVNVNVDGRRYCCEPLHTNYPLSDGLLQIDQPYGICFFVFDANCIEATSALPPVEMSEDMLRVMGSPDIPKSAEAAKRQFDAAFSAKAANVFRADTLEELADKMGVDKPVFLDTIRRYNESCRAGMDWEYLKPPQALVPLEKGPFFALRASAETLGAFGGVLVNAELRAYAADRRGVIENLFVTGDFASGRFVNIGGAKRQLLTDLAWAFSSGYLAGANAAAALSNQSEKTI